MILHITNDYSGSTVYKNLISQLDKLGLDQTVYNPIREASRINQNQIDFDCANSSIIYSHILNRHTDRLLYRKKIHKILNDIENKIDISKIKYIHAHTWYSDGGVAYLLSKKYNIPYIVAVRNTDLNLFFKYFIHERGFGKKILEHANNIITISEVYKNRMLNHPKLKQVKEMIYSKILVLPNGVDPYWIENHVAKTKNQLSNPINLLYVGKFDKGKNVVNLIKAIQLINKSNDKTCKLNLVGGGGNENEVILQMIENDSNINYLGKIYDLSQLQNIYRSNDLFLMPSKAETFGLVYVEAMLNGLPILYTKNEGIDNSYSENIGEKICKLDENEISDKILSLIKNYSNYEIPTLKLVQNHNWKLIAKKYIDLYTN